MNNLKMKGKKSISSSIRKEILEINLIKGQVVSTKNYRISLKEMKYVINGQRTHSSGWEDLVLR